MGYVYTYYFKTVFKMFMIKVRVFKPISYYRGDGVWHCLSNTKL